jgi:single-strand DNA-binding protein
MANLNKVFIIGRLTRDPDVRYTPKGTQITELGVAVNRTYQGDNGEKKEESVFVDVILWGKLAETAGQYLQKGRSVFCEGRLQLDSWDDKQTGQKRSRLRVIAENMQFLSQRAENEAGHSATATPARRPAAVASERRQPAPVASTAIPQDSDPFVDDVPF